MDFMTLPILAGSGPRYRQIVDAVEGAIGKGTLAPGAKLPPERSLAHRLHVSRTTIVAAYRELEARGLVRGHVGRGTFVCAGPDEDGAPFAWRGKLAAAATRATDTTLRDLVRSAANPSRLSFAAGVPALDVFPAAAFADLLASAVRRHPGTLWRHGPTEGQPRLRAAIAERYGRAASRVLVLSGAQQGLDLVTRCLVDPGDAVVMDRPGYLGAIQSFRSAGAKLVGWDSTHGDLDELEDLLLRHRPKLLYTNPTFHNPTGFTASLHARRDLLKVVSRYRVPVLEDNTYRELYFTTAPPSSLADLDDQLVISLNTFSKMLAPGLRIGWISAAEAIIEQLTLVKQRLDPHTQNLMQMAVADTIETGLLDHHLARLRSEHAARCAALVQEIQRQVPAGVLRIVPPHGGLYVWGRLAGGLESRLVLRHALERGVGFVSGEAFYVDGAGAQELRLCFSGVKVSEMKEGVKVLAESIARAQSAPASVSSMPLV